MIQPFKPHNFNTHAEISLYRIDLEHEHLYHHLTYEAAKNLLYDKHHWNEVNVSEEEVLRVQRDIKLRLSQILPLVLMNENLFTKDMLAIANKPLPIATLWQKIKFCFTVLFRK